MNAQTYTARKIDNMYHKFIYQQPCPGVIEIRPSSELLQGITLPKSLYKDKSIKHNSPYIYGCDINEYLMVGECHAPCT